MSTLLGNLCHRRNFKESYKGCSWHKFCLFLWLLWCKIQSKEEIHLKNSHGQDFWKETYGNKFIREDRFQCDSNYNRKDDLRFHERTAHDIADAMDEKAGVQCELCKIWYKNVKGLKEHRRKKHSEDVQSFECKFCGKSFNKNCFKTWKNTALENIVLYK